MTLGGDSGSVNGTTVNSTLEGGEPDPDDGLGGSVWYSWTPSRDGIATLSLNAPFVAMLAAYVGGPVGELSRARPRLGHHHAGRPVCGLCRHGVLDPGRRRVRPDAGGLRPGLGPLGSARRADPLHGDAGERQVALDWLPPEQNGGTPITGYLVYRGTTRAGRSC